MDMRSVKKSVQMASGIGVGTALGGVIIPRIMHPYLYNETYPPLLRHSLFAFVIGFIVSFLIFIFIEGIKSKVKSE